MGLTNQTVGHGLLTQGTLQAGINEVPNFAGKAVAAIEAGLAVRHKERTYLALALTGVVVVLTSSAGLARRTVNAVLKDRRTQLALTLLVHKVSLVTFSAGLGRKALDTMLQH